MHDHLKFGGGPNATILNPIVLLVVLILGVLICVGSRKKALAAFLAGSLLIPLDQVLLIGPAHFPMLRVLVLFGIIRMVREKAASKLRVFSRGINRIDIAVILLTLVVAVNGSLLFPESAALFNQLGNVYQVFGLYFLLRFLIRDEEDVLYTIQTLACIATIIAAIMTYEVSTGHSPYALLGGARAAIYASLDVRADKVRAQGPFAHSILAGTFGAVLVPLFIGLWWKGRKYHKIAALGIISATVITLACNSSTPVLGYAAGVLALCLWPIRRWMRTLRWGIVITLVTLQLVLKNNVWHLITRIDITGGSSSWHRYMLIDQCIRHFGDWWLIGVRETGSWGFDMWDTANQYVSTCDNSGLIPFILFLAVLVYGFKYLGRARRTAGKDKKAALFYWALGSALFANVVAFFGISYFDQTMVGWYALLAMIPAAIAVHSKKDPKKQVKPESIATPAQEPDLVSQFTEETAGMGAQRYST